jgi:NADH-quinone oxidoreductase subunit N
MDALIVVFACGLISLFAAFAKKPWLVLTAALGGLSIALALLICELTSGHSFVHLNYDGLRFSPFSLMFSASIVLFTGLMIGVGYSRFKEQHEHTGEYIGLLLFSASGAMIMTAFTDMFMFFLGLEILSLPIYVMAGSNKKNVRSTEASLKYFLMGSFVTGLLLFGIAWVYGATGSFKVDEIGQAVAAMNGPTASLAIGILFILAAFVFKVGAAPFHFWSPDVYDGAPAPVTGFMASVVKIAAFAAFIQLFHRAFGPVHTFWVPALSFLLVITLFVGNLSALRQTKLKRLLAYSSITHVGYTLLIIVSGSLNGAFDLFFYMTAYGFSIVALIAIAVAINDEEDRIEALKGLGKRSPLLAIAGVLAVLSLAGIPLTAGFFGKYMVFADAWQEHSTLVIIALVNSAISIYYYLKLLGVMVAKSDDSAVQKIQLSPMTTMIVIISIIGMIGLPFAIPFLIV